MISDVVRALLRGLLNRLQNRHLVFSCMLPDMLLFKCMPLEVCAVKAALAANLGSKAMVEAYIWLHPQP